MADKKPTVWVFGAGITGLTAAHEFAERGFTVIVVEKEMDQRTIGVPAVGGVARTQWALRPTEISPEGCWQSTIPLLPPLQLNFKAKNSDEFNTQAQERLKKYIEMLEKARESSGLKPQLFVNGYRAEYEEASLDRRRGEAVKKALDRMAEFPPGPPHKSLNKDNNKTPWRAEVFSDPGDAVPAEHGFRYFPAFYRHVFDTMKRIRLLDDHRTTTARPFQTVLDNLVPTRTTILAVNVPPNEEAPMGDPRFKISRDPPRSWREVQDLVAGLLGRLKYTSKDLAHLSLKITKYMTSGPTRRRAYEAMTWWDFVEGGALSERCAAHLDRSPEILAGMVAKESDARTQGNCMVQLLLNQLTGSRFSDATLNASTTSAWFTPWRDYLQEVLGVKFRCGILDGFKLEQNRILPVIQYKDLFGPTEGAKLDADDLFVIAAPIQAMIDSSDEDGLCKKFLACLRTAGDQLDESRRSPGDFEQLEAWIQRVQEWEWNSSEIEQLSSPLRHVSGIQFYFETDVHPTKGHTIYLDSAWGLSSISPIEFWTRPLLRSDGYRGMVSVDIGNWYSNDSRGKTAWGSSREEIARSVWGQMTKTIPNRERIYGHSVPAPAFYHLDDNIQFDEHENSERTTPCRNRAPYLIARPEDWPFRPGDLDTKVPATRYRVACGAWVLAGTYMKTYTRLTTMESANESARLAVNALLSHLGPERFKGPHCEIWNPEDEELLDLGWFKELDERLMDSGLPHALDILSSSSIADLLVLGFLR